MDVIRLNLQVLLLIVLAMLVLQLAGCSAAMQQRLEDGYQLGDLTSATAENVRALVKDYCSEEDEARRHALRASYLALTGSPMPINVCVASAVLGSGSQ